MIKASLVRVYRTNRRTVLHDNNVIAVSSRLLSVNEGRQVVKLFKTKVLNVFICTLSVVRVVIILFGFILDMTTG